MKTLTKPKRSLRKASRKASFDMSVEAFLEKHPDACSEGQQFARQYKWMSQVWDKCHRPDWMMWILNGLPEKRRPSDKVYRLFACWCARQVWDKLTDARSRNAVEVAERFAHRTATQAELDAAWAAAWDAAWDAAWAAAGAAAAWAAAGAATRAAAGAARFAAARAAARDAQAKQLRAMLPNPFKAAKAKKAAK